MFLTLLPGSEGGGIIPTEQENYDAEKSYTIIESPDDMISNVIWIKTGSLSELGHSG